MISQRTGATRLSAFSLSPLVPLKKQLQDGCSWLPGGTMAATREELPAGAPSLVSPVNSAQIKTKVGEECFLRRMPGRRRRRRRVVISHEWKQPRRDWLREPGVRRSTGRSHKAADCFSSADYSHLGLQRGQGGSCVSVWVEGLQFG